MPSPTARRSRAARRAPATATCSSSTPTAWRLYELFDAHPLNGGTSWSAGSGAVFDLASNTLRPRYWTSADAAGLPIFPGLVRYDEAVTRGLIDHAVRFTCPRRARRSSRRHATTRAATHRRRSHRWACASASSPRSTERICPRSAGHPRRDEEVGMILADNGGGSSRAPGPPGRRQLGAEDVPSSAFEVVKSDHRAVMRRCVDGDAVMRRRGDGDGDGLGKLFPPGRYHSPTHPLTHSLFFATNLVSEIGDLSHEPDFVPRPTPVN